MLSLNTAVLNVDSEFLDESLESISQEATDNPEEIVGEGEVELNAPEADTAEVASVDAPADPIATDEPKEESVHPAEPVVEHVSEPASTDGPAMATGPVMAIGVDVRASAIDYSYPYIWDEEHEKRVDERNFIIELQRATKEVEEKEALVEIRKRELETAISEVKLAEARHKKLSITGPVYRTRPEPRKPIATIEKESQPAASPAAEQDAKPVAAPNEDTSWRTIKTETILDGIERFGKTKREKLLEHFPTFGELMDARIEASKEHVSFASKLPSGIGENIATELINRMDAKIVPGM